MNKCKLKLTFLRKSKPVLAFMSCMKIDLLKAFTLLTAGVLLLQAIYPSGYWITQILLLSAGLEDTVLVTDEARMKLAQASLTTKIVPFFRFVFLIAALIAFLRISWQAHAFYGVVVIFHLIGWVSALGNPQVAESVMGYIVMLIQAVTIFLMLTTESLRGRFGPRTTS